MKNLYMKKIGLVLLMVSMMLPVSANYISRAPGGDFNHPANWVGDVVPSLMHLPITISNGSIIEKSDAFKWGAKATIEEDADLIVKSDFTTGYGGVDVYGNLIVEGSLIEGNGGATLVIKDGGSVTVNSVADGANITVEFGGVLIVNGDFSLSKTLTINQGGSVIINGNFLNGVVKNYGSFVVNGDYVNNKGGGIEVFGTGRTEVYGNMTGNQNFRVYKDGALLVFGNFASTGSNVYIEGSLVVAGDFLTSSSTTVNGEDGNLIVGGDFKASGGITTQSDNLYILDPNSDIDYPQNGNDYGGLDDLIENEDDYLKDLIEEVIPGFVNYASINQWVGADDDNWGNWKNWTANKIPESGASVRIKSSGFPPVIPSGSQVVVNFLTINPSAQLKLSPGAQLTVNGDLNINSVGGLILENKVGPNGLASLITEGSVSGEANVQLTLPREEWFYISHPIESARTRIYDVFMPGSTSANFRDFSHIAFHRNNKWYRVTGENISLRNLEGVSVKYTLLNENQPMHTLNYTGKLNNDPIARDFTSGGFYLFGNPYASSIDWEAEEGWSRSDIDGTIWYRTRVNDEMAFVTYNRFAAENAKVAVYPDKMSSADQSQLALIPPMQSVWIKATRATTFSVSPEVREHTEQGAMLKSTKHSGNGDVIRIVAENKYSRDGAVVYFWSNSIDELDRGDSEKRFNDSELVPEVYTRLDKMALAINGLGELTEQVKSIPLSVRNRVAGDVSLSFDLSHFYGEHAVYFEDKTTGAFLNVARNSTYEYSVKQTGEDHERFVLHLYKVTTALEEVRVENDEIAADEEISIKSIAGKVLVSVGMDLVQQNPGTIEIYAIDGRKISEVPARSSRTLVLLPNERGVYIVKAQFGQLVKSERVVNASK